MFQARVFMPTVFTMKVHLNPKFTLTSIRHLANAYVASDHR